MTLQWVIGPSRNNDRSITTLALLDARAACHQCATPQAVQRLAAALMTKA